MKGQPVAQQRAGAFDRDLHDGMARLAALEARLRAVRSELSDDDLAALSVLVRDAQAALLLLRAWAEGDMPPERSEREAGRLTLGIDVARLAGLPQPGRLLAVEAQLFATDLGARLDAAKAASASGKNEKPRRRQGRPRLHVVAPSA